MLIIPHSILLFLLLKQSEIIHGVRASDDELLWRTLNALQKASTFFERNVDEVNLDSIFGLRAAEGAVHNLVHDRSRRLNSVGKALMPTLHEIYKSLHKTGSAGFGSLTADGNEYSRGFRPVINTRWYYQRTVRSPVNAFIYTSDNVRDMDEETSDECMKDLLGTSFSSTKCTVTDACWNLMSQHGAFGYHLTHQGLFFILADIKGCSRQIEEKLKNVTTFHEQFIRIGTNVLHQMKETASHAFPPDEHDLFLEQGVVCKWLGMDGCFSRLFITEVLKWQHPSGCYKDVEKKRKNNMKSSTAALRKLQMEKTLRDGCQSHTTGLLVAYLAHALHWMMTEELRPRERSRVLSLMVSISSEYLWVMLSVSCILSLLAFRMYVRFRLRR